MQQLSLFPDGFELQEQALHALRELDVSRAAAMIDRARAAGARSANLEAIAAATSIPLIASGGAGTLQHLADALAPGRADAALAASIFHFGEFRVREAKTFLARQGIPMRQ